MTANAPACPLLACERRCNAATCSCPPCQCRQCLARARRARGNAPTVPTTTPANDVWNALCNGATYLELTQAGHVQPPDGKDNDE